MQGHFSSKTIRGLVISVFAMIIGMLAKQHNIDISEADTASFLAQVADITERIVAPTLEGVGLVLAYIGRLNPDIKPIGKDVTNG